MFEKVKEPGLLSNSVKALTSKTAETGSARKAIQSLLFSSFIYFWSAASHEVTARAGRISTR